jgi:predicted SprT family Zn-dependent metalloprotease
LNLFEAANLAKSLMRQHGLVDAGWSFKFDHARRRFGSCAPTLKRITLSRPLTFLNTEAEVRDTILHEIAHALTPGDGHGRKWKAACVRIGAKPQRCYTDQQVVAPPRRPAPMQIGCTRCDLWSDRRRRPAPGTKYICRRCRGPVVVRDAVA